MVTGSTVATIAGAQEVVALGRNVDVLTETVIRRPVTVVAAFAETRATPRVVRRHRLRRVGQTPPPVAVGTRMAFVARFLGRRLTYAHEVTELVPRERLVMRTTNGPFPMETTYTWESLDAGATRMTLRNRGRPANRKDLAELRTLLETGA